MLSTLNTSWSGIALNVADSPYKCANGEGAGWGKAWECVEIESLCAFDT